jgi:predicted acyl esterase
VPVHIALSPMAMLFHAGETLELSIGALNVGRIPIEFGWAKVPFPVDGLTFEPDRPTETRLLYGPAEPDATRRAAPLPDSRNRGRHVLWQGGRYDAQVLMPLIEPGDGA